MAARSGAITTTTTASRAARLLRRLPARQGHRGHQLAPGPAGGPRPLLHRRDARRAVLAARARRLPAARSRRRHRCADHRPCLGRAPPATTPRTRPTTSRSTTPSARTLKSSATPSSSRGCRRTGRTTWTCSSPCRSSTRTATWLPSRSSPSGRTATSRSAGCASRTASWTRNAPRRSSPGCCTAASRSSARARSHRWRSRSCLPVRSSTPERRCGCSSRAPTSTSTPPAFTQRHHSDRNHGRHIIHAGRRVRLPLAHPRHTRHGLSIVRGATGRKRYRRTIVLRISRKVFVYSVGHYRSRGL